jgi:hypothetical protein
VYLIRLYKNLGPLTFLNTPMASPTVLALAAVFCAFFVRYLLQRRTERRKALPPGPPGYPLIGNALEIPTSQEWLTYAKWGKQYGTTEQLFHLNSLD